MYFYVYTYSTHPQPQHPAAAALPPTNLAKKNSATVSPNTTARKYPYANRLKGSPNPRATVYTHGNIGHCNQHYSISESRGNKRKTSAPKIPQQIKLLHLTCRVLASSWRPELCFEICPQEDETPQNYGEQEDGDDRGPEFASVMGYHAIEEDWDSFVWELEDASFTLPANYSSVDDGGRRDTRRASAMHERNGRSKRSLLRRRAGEFGKFDHCGCCFGKDDQRRVACISMDLFSKLIAM